MWRPVATRPAWPGTRICPSPVTALPRQIAPSVSEPANRNGPKDSIPSGWKPGGRSMRAGRFDGPSSWAATAGARTADSPRTRTMSTARRRVVDVMTGPRSAERPGSTTLAVMALRSHIRAVLVARPGHVEARLRASPVLDGRLTRPVVPPRAPQAHAAPAGALCDWRSMRHHQCRSRGMPVVPLGGAWWAISVIASA